MLKRTYLVAAIAAAAISTAGIAQTSGSTGTTSPGGDRTNSTQSPGFGSPNSAPTPAPKKKPAMKKKAKSRGSMGQDSRSAGSGSMAPR